MSYSHSNKVVVGISSRSSEGNLQWLMDFIRCNFQDVVSDVWYLPITNSNTLQWEERVRRCSVGILYHTKHQGRLNIVDVTGALYDTELQSLSRTLGRPKVMVVLDDMENCSEEERQRIIGAQHSLTSLSSQLLLFPEESKLEVAYRKKEEFRKILGYSTPPQLPQVNTAKFKGYAKTISDIIDLFNPKSGETSSGSKQNSHSKDLVTCKPSIKSRLRIGIFSRSAAPNYEWLMGWLKTTCTMGPVDVHAVHITNDNTKFFSELPNCSFAILYHTLNQGRLNVTDVTDSMYNEELMELSKHLGQKNVIVILDDLQNTSSDEKKRILETQPSIGRLARELYLFNEKNKSSENLEKIKRIIMEKTQNNIVMDIDHLPAITDRKSDKSRKSTMHQDEDDYWDGGTCKSTSSQSSYTTDSKGQELSSACRDPKGSGEPENKRFLPDPSTWNPQSLKAVAEVDNTFQEACSKWQDCRKIIQEDLRAMQRVNEELQSENTRLRMEVREKDQRLEAHERLLKDLYDRDTTIDRLRKDLYDRDTTIEENHQTIKMLKQQNEELQKILIEGDERQTGTESALNVEKPQEFLSDKGRTTEGNHEIIQKMRQESQRPQNYNHEIEIDSRQEGAGQKVRRETGARECQRYGERRPIPGQDDDEKTPCEHRSCTGDMKHEGSQCAKPRRSLDTTYDQQLNPTQIQSLTSANHRIEQLTRTIQEKDAEIRWLNSALNHKEVVINEMLDAAENRDGKAKR